MRQFIVALAALMLLAGCATKPQIVREKAITIKHDSALYQCDMIKKLPDADGLTEVEVAHLIKRLYADNKRCKLSMDALKKQIANEKFILGKA